MQKKQHLYYEIWKRVVPDIRDLLEILPDYSMIQLSPIDFQEASERQNYTFRLEFDDARVINNIDGSAVARDLVDAVETSPEAISFLKGKHVIVNMDQNFSLHLRQI